MTLIPKKKQQESIKNLHPIFLCNIIYKVLSRTLDNWLWKVLSSLISKTQSIFVLGKHMIDNILLAFEIIHHKNNNSEETIRSGIKDWY